MWILRTRFDRALVDNYVVRGTLVLMRFGLLVKLSWLKVLPNIFKDGSCFEMKTVLKRRNLYTKLLGAWKWKNNSISGLKKTAQNVRMASFDLWVPFCRMDQGCQLFLRKVPGSNFVVHAFPSIKSVDFTLVNLRFQSEWSKIQDFFITLLRLQSQLEREKSLHPVSIFRSDDFEEMSSLGKKSSSSWSSNVASSENDLEPKIFKNASRYAKDACSKPALKCAIDSLS